MTEYLGQSQNYKKRKRKLFLRQWRKMLEASCAILHFFIFSAQADFRLSVIDEGFRFRSKAPLRLT